MDNEKNNLMENEELTIRIFREEDSEGFRELFHKVFNQKISPEFFRWKYYGNPYSAEELTTYLALNSKGQIVGVRTMFPGKIVYKGREYNAVQAGDTMVDEAYRGRGIFKRLNQYALEDLKKKGYEVIYNFPNANSFPGNIKMGWKYMGDVYKYLKVLNYQRVLKNKFYKVPLAGICGRLVDLLSSICGVRKFSGYTIEEADSFTREIIDYMEFALMDKVHHKRDEAYLNWKFLNKPNNQYKIIVVRKDKTIASLFIVRLDENNGLKLGNIMDYCANNPADVTVGLKILVKYCRKLGMDYLSTWYICDEHFKRGLERNFFIKRKTRIKFVVNPLKEGLDLFTDLSLWHVTYGDADTA